MRRLTMPSGIRPVVLIAAVLLLGCGPGGSPPETIAPTLPDGPPLLTLAFVGDTIGHGLVMDADDPDPLTDVAPLLAGQDVFVFNHEGILVDQPPPPGTCAALPYQTILDAHPHAADFLLRAPFNVATLANNHVLDCGEEGLDRTLSELRARGILAGGAGPDAATACEPIRLRVNGTDVAILSYVAISPDHVAAGPTIPGAATWEECGGASRVADVAATGAFVVVALHLHLARSWTDYTADAHITLVEEVLDAGADLVVAHGSHVPQGILVRGGRLALLSLGNFLFDQDYPIPDAARDSLVAQVAVYAGHLGVTLVPLRLDATGRPAVPDGATGRRILDHVALLSRRTGGLVAVSDGLGRVVVERAP